MHMATRVAGQQKWGAICQTVGWPTAPLSAGAQASGWVVCRALFVVQAVWLGGGAAVLSLSFSPSVKVGLVVDHIPQVLNRQLVALVIGGCTHTGGQQKRQADG